ncbi:3' exoribonuclease family, domain 1 [Trichuris suis]|nr:3' exoribonuclease family, domain 1 [Trichuris suis]
MRLIPLAICEREFLKNCFETSSRVDGRTNADFRPVKLNFGHEYGSCVATFGKTKVFAKVSSSIVVPRPNRPSSGRLVVNLELSPMACSYFEGSRPDTWIEMQRLLERMLKESNCVELESLCVLAGEKVWQIRCDLYVIDNDGSLLDCAMFAAMAALKHFRIPVVSISGRQFVIHDPTERAMVPLTIYSCSFCVSTGICKEGETLLVSDMNDREEMAVDEIVVIAMNSYREVSLFHVRKYALIDTSDVLRCQGGVSVRVNYLTYLLNEAIKKDNERRMAGEKVNFGELITTDSVSNGAQNKLSTLTLADGKTRLKGVSVAINRKTRSEELTLKVSPGPSSSMVVQENIEETVVDVDMEIEEILQECTQARTPVCTSPARKIKKRHHVLPEDVSSILDGIEEDMEILNDPDLL